MVKEKNIGLFSGSFNPIHIGHLALTNWLCEYEGFDEIWFLVTPHNPLKKRETLLEDQQRLKMVKKALTGYPQFKASDFEFKQPSPTYTIDTLRALQEHYPKNRFHLIIGADNWETIDRWKESETLIHQYPIIIYPRLGYNDHIPKDLKNIRRVNAPIIEISSTMIRQAIYEGRELPYFLPEQIREEVKQYYGNR